MSKYQNGHHCYLQFACLPLRCVRLGVFHISTARASALLHFALCLLLCTSGVDDGRKAAAPALDVWKGSAWISLPARCTPPHANNQGSPSSPGPRAGGCPPVSVLQQDRGRTAMRHDQSQERHALFQTFPILWMKAFWLSLLQTAKILSFFVKVRDLQIKPLQSRT